MKIFIDSKYLTFPVNNGVSSKRVSFFENGELVFELNCKIDMISPKFTAYVDVSRFMGRTLEVTVSPEMAVNIGMCDEMDMTDFGHEKYRPQIHFTVINGWNNDPNGLIKYNGRYHMFYQYNPCATEWENMHWGHAVSDDLFHWEHKDTALFPDENGTMYSGCAIEDTKNLSGVGNGAERPMLVYYTAAGGHGKLSEGKFYDQRLAYSTDNGETLVKYEGDALIPTIEKGNRDPKVVWVEEIGRYILALYMVKNKYSFFVSDDLVSWEHYQDIEIAEDCECPDIYSISVDGKNLWVLSGANDIYILGEFTKDGFVRVQDEKRLTHKNKVNYAAQSFSGIDDGRVIRIAWNRLGVGVPNSRFSQQMSVPTQMGLLKRGEEYFLTATPVNEIESLYDQKFSFNGPLTEKAVRFDVGESPIDVKINIKHNGNTVLRPIFFGVPLIINFNDGFVSWKNIKMPFDRESGEFDIRIIIDRCSLEAFMDSGSSCFSDLNLCDYNLPYIEFPKNSGIENIEIECYTLRSVYNDQKS